MTGPTWCTSIGSRTLAGRSQRQRGAFACAMYAAPRQLHVANPPLATGAGDAQLEADHGGDAALVFRREDHVQELFGVDFGAYLGHGAFGVAFESNCRATGERFAVKVYDSAKVSLDNIQRECRVLEALRGSAHVVEIRGHGPIAQGSYGIVMELASGGEVSRAPPPRPRPSEAHPA